MKKAGAKSTGFFFAIPRLFIPDNQGNFIKTKQSKKLKEIGLNDDCS
jgi:hypothetical protein